MERQTFSESELIELLINAQELFDDDNDDIFFVKDLAARLNCSLGVVRNMLRPLVAEGRVQPARKGIIDLAGRRTTTIGYRLVDK